MSKQLFMETSHFSSQYRIYKPEVKFHQIFIIVLSFMTSLLNVCLIFIRTDILHGILARSLLQLALNSDKKPNAVH